MIQLTESWILSHVNVRQSMQNFCTPVWQLHLNQNEPDNRLFRKVIFGFCDGITTYHYTYRLLLLYYYANQKLNNNNKH